MLPEIKSLLKEIGLKDKEIAIYNAILPLGSASIRELAQKTGINRGTVHDVLECLVDRGLVFSEKRGERRKFIVSSPDKIVSVLEQEEKQLQGRKEKVSKSLPTLLSFYAKQGGRPSVKYFDNDQGIRKILEDILETLSNEKEKISYVYSSKSMRSVPDYVYKLFPDFTKEKIKRGIKTKVISMGGGGDPENLVMAERKSIKIDAPAYFIIYANKLALISIAEDKSPFGVLITDEKIAATQKILFEELWECLK